MTQKLNTIIDKVKELKQLMQEQGKTALKEAFQEFFVAHPEAKSIVWTQYTPYFNDGDACTFSVGELCLNVHWDQMAEDVRKLSGRDQEDDEDAIDSYYCAPHYLHVLSAYDSSYWSADRKEAGVERRELTASEQSLVDDFDNLVSAANQLEEVFELVFGDHVQVTATAEGFEVEEYDHD